MLSITRRLEFDAGHRLLNHEGKCRNYHGHRYVVDVQVQTDSALREGMVIDFGRVKAILGEWIDKFFDHGMLLEENDPMIELCEETRTKVYVFPGGNPPTAENISTELHRQAQLMLGPEYTVMKVRVYETPNCWADNEF